MIDDASAVASIQHSVPVPPEKFPLEGKHPTGRAIDKAARTAAGRGTPRGPSPDRLAEVACRAMPDPFELDRFVKAQDPVLAQVRHELGTGRKLTHWMWFVFPQLAGLGHSPMARRYAIGSLAEARAYLDHPVLGPRLDECAKLVNRAEGRSINEILGSPDDLKFRSSMTLFAAARTGPSVFRAALDRHFSGEPDPLTVEGLARA